MLNGLVNLIMVGSLEIGLLIFNEFIQKRKKKKTKLFAEIVAAKI